MLPRNGNARSPANFPATIAGRLRTRASSAEASVLQSGHPLRFGWRAYEVKLRQTARTFCTLFSVLPIWQPNAQGLSNTSKSQKWLSQVVQVLFSFHFLCFRIIFFYLQYFLYVRYGHHTSEWRSYIFVSFRGLSFEERRRARLQLVWIYKHCIHELSFLAETIHIFS